MTSSILGPTAPSRVTKATKTNVSGVRSSATRSSHRGRRSATVVDTATLQVSVVPTAPYDLPGLGHEPQYETISLGPQHGWSHTGLPIYSGSVTTLNTDSQPGFPSNIPSYFPPIPDEYQYLWSYDGFNNVPFPASVQSAWGQYGFHHISLGSHSHPGQLDQVPGAADLSYDNTFSQPNQSNDLAELAMVDQQDTLDDANINPDQGFSDENPYNYIPSLELGSSIEPTNPAHGWVIVDSPEHSDEAGDEAGPREFPQSGRSTADNTRSPPGDSPLEDPVEPPESDSSEGNLSVKTDAVVVRETYLDGLKKRTRKNLDPTRRKETSDTRRLKACVRCRMQKIRVSS